MWDLLAQEANVQGMLHKVSLGVDDNLPEEIGMFLLGCTSKRVCRT